MSSKTIDERWMQRAIELAQLAQTHGEVPIGAVIVDPLANKCLGEGYNQPIQLNDPSAHAEIVALRAAAQNRSNYRLTGATLYVTLEPCAMCAGAIVHARIQRVVIATPEPRAGAAGSVFNLLNNPHLNHRCEICFGPGQFESKQLLNNFFTEKR